MEREILFSREFSIKATNWILEVKVCNPAISPEKEKKKRRLQDLNLRG